MSVLRLCLGTAKLGMPWYGAGSVSRPGPVEIEAILKRAVELGITHFDTAAAYGDAEDWLVYVVPLSGTYITKVSPTLARCGALAARAWSDEGSAPVFQYLLLHNPRDAADFNVLGELVRCDGRAGRIGASVYTPDQAIAALHACARALQVPYCLLDRRHEAVIRIARDRGVVVFARQPFLQGLLTNGVQPAKFHASVRAFLLDFDRWRSQIGGMSRVEACLRVALDTDADYVVFGVGSVAHLEEVVEAASRPVPLDWLSMKAELFQLADRVPSFVLPSLWG